MKPARIFQQYIWIINTLRHQRLTLEELNSLWMEQRVADGSVLHRSSFNRHRESILEMFGINIACNLSDYRYYVKNADDLRNGTIPSWLFSTLSVHGILTDSVAVKDRIVLEEVPAGEVFLNTIIRAIRTDHKVVMTYQRFGADPYDKTVAPYALKLFHQRWYMLSFTGNHYATYSLDRMQAVRLSEETFTMPEDFSPKDYFSEYYGVMTDETPMARVVVRAYGKQPDYLRTLPLHASQRELASTEDYTDFSYDIRPTIDFLNELLSRRDEVEVLSPDDVRQKMRDLVQKMLNRY